jgi:hypothetical protein
VQWGQGLRPRTAAREVTGRPGARAAGKTAAKRAPARRATTEDEVLCHGECARRRAAPDGRGGCGDDAQARRDRPPARRGPSSVARRWDAPRGGAYEPAGA